LRQRAVAVTANHLADQPDRADPDLFADHGLRQFQPDQRTVYLKYLAHLHSIGCADESRRERAAAGEESCC